MSAEPFPPDCSRKAKWTVIADAARARIAARGWRHGIDAEVQIADEIARDPETRKAFLQCARGRTGSDPQSLRHRLILEVRRSCTDGPARLGLWYVFRNWLSRFFNRNPSNLHP